MNFRRRGMLAGVLTLLLLGLTVGVFANSTGSARAANAAVNVGTPTNRFTPNVVTVNVGDTVTFTQSAGTHTATSVTAGLFDIGLASAGATGSKTFTAAGTFYYYCFVHSAAGEATEANVVAGTAMVGKVVVQASAVATNTPVPPTATAVPPTATTAAATATTVAPTATATTAAATATATGAAATATPTRTAVPATAVPPTATTAPATAVPATATTAPATAVPATATRPAPAPPASGSGLDGGSGGNAMPVLLGLAAIVAFGLSGASYAAVKRRR